MMRLAEPEQEVEVMSPRIFATTQWNVVSAAGELDSEPSRRALETLCATYWYPIYVYVRRKGHGPDDAQDLTQEFFAQLIAKQHLRLADRNKGRFRSFLLATLDFFLAREWSRAHRQKRGGQYKFVSLDQPSPEERYQLEPADDDTPEKQFLSGERDSSSYATIGARLSMTESALRVAVHRLRHRYGELLRAEIAETV